MTSVEKKAFQDLLSFVTSGKRYMSQNPYTIPEVKAALKVLEPEEYKRLFGKAKYETVIIECRRCGVWEEFEV